MEKAITAEFQRKPFGITLAPLKNNNNITVLYDIEDDTQQQQLKDCKYYILCAVDDILVYDIISFENIITQIKTSNEMKMCFIPLTYVSEFKDRFKWMPHFKFTTDYVGNGFVRLKITKWNAGILHFEFDYCFIIMNGINNPKNVTIDPSLYRSLTFKTNKLNKKNIVLIRIPQRSSNYFFCFQIRALCIQPNTTHVDMNTHKYTSLYEHKLHIPFDAPIHQFQVGDTVQFSKTNDSFYNTGKIEEMLMENSIAIVLIKIKMENNEIKEQRYNINVDKLRMETRYRSKLLDLTDWIEISKSLLLKGRSEETINTFIAVYNGLIFYFKHYIYKKRDIIFTEFIYDNDGEQDIASCSRYITWNIIEYLGEDIVVNNGINIIKRKTIRCGLCGINNGYHIKMRLESIWIEELRNYMEVKRRNIPVNWSLTTSNYNGLGTMCDICQIGFHRLSYCFHCCVNSITKKHDICLPCMNRNVVQFNRLNIVLNDLYDIHGLDTFCVLQIVSCLIGWINISN